MNTADYYRSLSAEMTALKNRVRHLIGKSHWPTDGEFKETVLRTMLRRSLPRTVEVGRGFIVSDSGNSGQIDVLIYSTNSPVLFRDGDLVFITPDAVRGIIEVKANLTNTTYRKAVKQLIKNASHVQKEIGRTFLGIFGFDGSIDSQFAVDFLRDNANGNPSLVVDFVCAGPSHFIRWWKADAHHPGTHGRWIAYPYMNELAPGYFLHNAIEFLAPMSVKRNPEVWFPNDGKARFEAATSLFVPDKEFHYLLQDRS